MQHVYDCNICGKGYTPSVIPSTDVERSRDSLMICPSCWADDDKDDDDE
jgi:DNA-directed RNA polymerase subunit RPC12/RpoP